MFAFLQDSKLSLTTTQKMYCHGKDTITTISLLAHGTKTMTDLQIRTALMNMPVGGGLTPVTQHC